MSTFAQTRPTKNRAHICHEYHEFYPWRKNCHVEKFGVSIKNLNNFVCYLFQFYVAKNLRGENLCGEKMTNMRSDLPGRGGRFNCKKRGSFWPKDAGHFQRSSPNTHHPPVGHGEVHGKRSKTTIAGEAEGGVLVEHLIVTWTLEN